jgi:ribosomal-protein-alanine N-acetyltransferase
MILNITFMTFLSNPHLDLTKQIIETPRCILVPFSLDGRVDIRELATEFCKANKDLFIGPYLPNYEQEIAYVKEVIQDIETRKTFETFILERWTNQLIGCVGLNRPEEHRMNIWLWIRVDEHGKWYATEAYIGLISWAKENTKYSQLKHTLDPRNIASRKLALKFGGILQDETNEKWDEIYHIPI